MCVQLINRESKKNCAYFSGDQAKTTAYGAVIMFFTIDFNSKNFIFYEEVNDWLEC